MNCYNTGTITGYNHAGGIVAFELGGGSNAKSIVKNCYNRGTVKATSTNEWFNGAGGITGNRGSTGSSTYSNNYWLSTSGPTYGIGGDINNNTGATSKTASQLKALTSTLGSAYKADSNNINSGYPILSWQ